MKKIVKSTNPPKIFEDWQIRKKFTLSDLQKKKDLPKIQSQIWKQFQKKTEVRNPVKNSLLLEQGFICCYCQQEIESSIEHFISRNANPLLMFDYNNLLACCKGGEEERQSHKLFPSYCGASKRNDNLEISPLDLECEDHFDYFLISKEQYLQIGVRGKTEKGQEAVRILNLDNEELRRQRGAVLETIFDENNTKEDLILLLNYYENQINKKPDNKFPPFCIVALNILRKLI